jgi:hypothetical protein
MEINVTWEQWKKLLGLGVNTGQFIGLSEDGIDTIAYLAGELFANKIDPANVEQKLLNELWSVGTEKEQQDLARLIVRLVDKKA